ncbi:MAG: hypothetical protein RL693_2096, partial [Verrucomicrobiota bacterium]
MVKPGRHSWISQGATLLVLLVAMVPSADAQTPLMSVPNNTLSWEKLTALPDPEGFASPFAGVSGEALIVA